jgi:hypothetical protein
MPPESDLNTSLRNYKIAFVIGVVLSGGGIALLRALNVSNATIGTPLPFLGLLALMIGIISIVVTILGYSQVLYIDRLRNQAGQTNVLDTKTRRTVKVIVYTLLVLGLLWQVAPFVLRPIYGVPIFGQSQDEIQAKLNDPNFIGCFQRPLHSKDVLCKGTGYDGLLEFLMTIVGTTSS